MSYRVPLKVCTTKGTRIIAKVSQVSGEKNRIDLPYIEAVEKDSPKFAKKGIVRIMYGRTEHKQIIETLESYLENIFLKELDSENNNTSKPIKSNKRRDKKSLNTCTTGKSKGKDSDTIHNSGRGYESTEGTRRGIKDPELVKECDSEDKE